MKHARTGNHMDFATNRREISIVIIILVTLNTIIKVECFNKPITHISPTHVPICCYQIRRNTISGASYVTGSIVTGSIVTGSIVVILKQVLISKSWMIVKINEE